MFICLRNNLTVFLLSVICLTVASICQLLIPSVIAKSLSALTTGSINAEFYFNLIAVFLTKLSSQALGNSIATLMEARSRFLLINFIVHDKRPSPLCSRVTLIKEDAEKIASVIHDTIHLIGSCILTVSAAYILLRENIYFFLPIALIIVLTCVQLRFAKPVIQRLYAAEMSKEDLYKESLISAFNVSSDGKQSKMQLIRSYGYLKDTVRARYKYLKASAIQCLSHGEAMEALFQHRFKAQGLYVLDEPEASLSPLRQLVFINRIMELSRGGAQFIIATHSPLIMSIPGCDLRQISGGRCEQIAPEDTDAYAVYKAVLNSAGAYITKNMQ